MAVGLKESVIKILNLVLQSARLGNLFMGEGDADRGTGTDIEVKIAVIRSAMDHLFTAHITVNTRKIPFDVRLENDLALFRPEGEDAELPGFGFKREGEEWKELQPLDEPIKRQALSALEKYLLSQH